ncbi:MAG: UDP-2,3-diacylglucosamine diphosphatase [Bacteroidales bacterium]
MEKRVYFISDLHLGASYIKDKAAQERHVVSWLDSIKGSAKALYMVGDIMDYWYEYKYVVPRGYVRFLGKLAELVDRGVEVVWFKGNHDIWLFDYMQSEIGVKVVDNSLTVNIAGKIFFIAHGDGVGNHKLGFKIVRSIMRNRIVQRCYSFINPRLTIPFAKGCSKSSRDKSQGKEEQSCSSTQTMLMNFSKEYLAKDNEIDYFIYGHLHVVRDLPLSEGCRFIILGDWVSKYSYGVFDGKDFKFEYYPLT